MSKTSREGVYEQRESTSFGPQREPAERPGEASEDRWDGWGRWSIKRKFAAIRQLLRGEDIETISRELGVTAATLSAWRDQFLEGGAATLKVWEANVEDEESQRLKSLAVDPGISNALPREKIHHLRYLTPAPARQQYLALGAAA